MAGAYTDASTESWNAAFLVNDGDDTRTVSSLSFTDISDGHMTGATAQDQHRIVEHSIDPWCARAFLGHGVRLQGLTEENHSSFIPSRHPVALSTEHINSRMVSTVNLNTVVTISKVEASLMRLGMSKSAARTTAPWVSFVEGDASVEEEHAIHITCRKSYIRVVVTCQREELQPNPAFVADIEGILTSPTKERQTEGLRRVLRQWGAVFATYVELGCALVASHDLHTPCEIPGFGQTWDPRNIAAQKGAEKLFHHAAQCKFGTQAPGHNDAEKDFFNDFSHSLFWQAVGGTPEMHITNQVDAESLQMSEVWTVISLGHVFPTLDLLKHGHPDLYQKCQDLIPKPEPIPTALTKRPSSPPIFSFPCRLVCRTNGNPDSGKTNGYIEYDLSNFDPRQDFTIGAWMYLTGEHRANTMALTISCAELKSTRALVSIGEWNRSGHWLAFRSILPFSEKDAPFDGLQACGTFSSGSWKYIALTQTSERLNFHVGAEVVSKPITQRQEIPATELQLSIGRGVWESRQCDQWDGAIENVNIWQRALSMEEIAEEGHQSRCPAPYR